MKNMSRETAITIEARVMRGVKNALHRSWRRLALSASNSSGDFDGFIPNYCRPAVSRVTLGGIS